MSTITKELAKLFRKITNSEIDAEGNAHVVLFPADSLLINNARIALASLEAEPVAWLLSGGGAKNNVSFDSGNAYADPLREVTPLYTAPPAPISVPAAMEMDDDFDSSFEHGKAVGWNAYRAAMLQGADRPQNEPQNIPENIPATQFKPVADLYGLTSPTGGETSFTFDAVEARDFIDGGWSCQDYVELERFQEAVSGNSPVIPDGWVACSERMPEVGSKVIVFRPSAEESNDPPVKTATYKGGREYYHGFDCYCEPTHWMPLPAAPQQEVK
ncbi:DUF551 domain-containing protein [Enterobacter asburiae]|uniref:DUF551 domain-containing protein n=1 Tax=Enterobacter asburiae TaxID=61645 RepID=UPI002FF9530C